MAAASPANRSARLARWVAGISEGAAYSAIAVMFAVGRARSRRASAARAARTSRPSRATRPGAELARPAGHQPTRSPLVAGPEVEDGRQEPHPQRALDQQGVQQLTEPYSIQPLAGRRGGSSRAARWAGVGGLISSCSACSRRLSSLISDTFSASIAIKPGRRQVSVYEPGNFCRGAEPVRIPVISSPAAASAAGWWCRPARCAAPPGRRSR